jgi:hypothetical protein
MGYFTLYELLFVCRIMFTFWDCGVEKTWRNQRLLFNRAAAFGLSIMGKGALVCARYCFFLLAVLLALS